MDLSQILAIVIFVGMFVVIVWGKVHRYIPALVGAAAVVIIVFLVVMQSSEAAVRVFNLGQIGTVNFWVPGHEPLASRGINWQTVIFIGGMMTMVEGLGQAGVLRWMCLSVAKLVNYRVVPVFFAFMLLAGFLSMFIDSITVMLFLAAVTVELARLLKVDPIPLIISQVAAANIGGSATMAGDPPNIIIGTGLGFSFMDFVVNTGPIAWAGMIVALGFFYLVFRRSLHTAVPGQVDGVPAHYPQPKEAITNRTQFLLDTGVLLVVVILLVTHAQTGISVALIGVVAFALTLLVPKTRAQTGQIVRRIDWRTLLFFIGLFVTVGGLEETGVLERIARFIEDISGGSQPAVMSIVLWSSAILSSLIDNIPFAATMVPVVASLAAAAGTGPETLSWALALGTDIGGNGTPIGASANVVATAIAEREGYPIGWGRFCKTAYPGMILVLGLCQVLMLVRYF
jgi:Na+/H+ antiporter NhaD/arsenite permease-like protein